jgi:hypothetical protein
MIKIFRTVLGVLAVMAAIWALKAAVSYWGKFQTEHPSYVGESAAKGPGVDGENLTGLPSQLEPLLRGVQKQGVAVFRKWLDFYGPQISDPRKAWIELDYVLMAAREDMAEARRVFAEVKQRTPKTSPVYERIKRLGNAYE